MAYEIPQQLQYEEKIIFGLTFNQLIYAAVFFPIIFLVAMKTDFDISVKATIIFFLVVLAILLMFFNFKTYAKNVIKWLTFFESRLMDKDMKEFIGVEKIEKDAIHIKK